MQGRGGVDGYGFMQADQHERIQRSLRLFLLALSHEGYFTRVVFVGQAAIFEDLDRFKSFGKLLKD